MKVFVINPFFDNKGLHKKGEICEVSTFNASYMQLIEEEKKEVVEIQEVKKPVRKTTRRKKG